MQQVNPVLEGIISMVLGSYKQSRDESDGVVNQGPSKNIDVPLVLALPANTHNNEPINFLHHEIPPEALNAVIDENQAEQGLIPLQGQIQLNNNEDVAI
jgi:hypothetical protein